MEAKSKFFDPKSVKVASRPGSIWIRLLPWAYFSLAALVLVLVVGVFWPVVEKNRTLLAKRQSMEKDLERAENLNERLQQEFQALQNDPQYIERIARDTLNLGKRGETIFRFQPYETNSPSISLPEKNKP